MFNFLSWTSQINNDIWILNKFLDKFLIFQVSTPMNPWFVDITNDFQLFKMLWMVKVMI